VHTHVLKRQSKQAILGLLQNIGQRSLYRYYTTSDFIGILGEELEAEKSKFSLLVTFHFPISDSMDYY
jgi:hypothetical protein